MKSAIAHQWDFSSPVSALAINRRSDFVAVALGDGTVRLISVNDESEDPKSLKLHQGVALSLTADADDHGFLSGGDDGKVFIIDPSLTEPTLVAEHKNQWVDHVASSSDGKYRAYTEGKNIHILDEEGQDLFESLLLPSSPGHLAFSPNNKRLAASHYGGVALWWVNSKEKVPQTLSHKGSHLNLVWSPDSKILLTAMQDNTLHGWQISDGKEMVMQGYASKIRSMAFTAKGKYLVTSGSEQIICWPFFGGGPWGKAPLVLGGTENRLVTTIAPHPKDEMVAAGYNDGMIVLAPLDGRMEMMIATPSATSINGLVWDQTGESLFASTESGIVMLFTIDSVRKALVTTG